MGKTGNWMGKWDIKPVEDYHEKILFASRYMLLGSFNQSVSSLNMPSKLPHLDILTSNDSRCCNERVQE
jgi:hypothetical protein